MPGPVTGTVGSRMVARFGAARFGAVRFGFVPRDTEVLAGVYAPVYRHQPVEVPVDDTHTTVQEA